VRVLPALHPVDVAGQAAVVDHLTDGRYMLGVGAGSEFKLFMDQRGLDHAQRHARLLESLDVIVRCWTSQEPITYAGQFWHGTNVLLQPKPLQKPHPPIGVASDQDDVIRLAAQRGYTLLAAQYDSASFLERKADLYAAAAGGACPRQKLTVARMVHVADTDAQAWANVRADVERDFAYAKSISPHNILFFRQRNEGLEDVTLEHMVAAGAFFIGSPHTVYAELAAFYRACGGFGGLLLVMGKDWGTREQRTRSLELFIEQVAPRLAGLEQAQEVARDAR
jgi:alkanesulfonate monooxygenase SsuD/methylene tetrahydromethanopterin reductase-like flavin-dependent oxidoreductase (luciferase family)